MPGNCMIVTELLPRGDVETLLRNKKIELTLFHRMKVRECVLYRV